jgi:hypothetical protein
MKENDMANRPPLTPDEEWRYAQTALSWYGWGSPVGLGIGLVCLSLAALIGRFVIFGF